jgi:hypothetical protein
MPRRRIAIVGTRWGGKRSEDSMRLSLSDALKLPRGWVILESDLDRVRVAFRLPARPSRAA